MTLDTSNEPAVRVGRISFINVDPIYYGMEHKNLSDDFCIESAPPVELNRMMAEGSLDISSVSSAAYGAHHKEWLLLPGLSIACTGDVMSVILVGRMPLERLDGKRILISEDSATAAALMKLMFAHKGVSPRLEVKKVRSPSDIDSEAAGALVIGDASMRYEWHKDFEYVWDLGDLWARHAKLPFVFAVWAVRKEFAAAHPSRVSRMVALFHESKRLGIENLETVVKTASSKLRIDPGVTRRYFENFCYDFGEPEKLGLAAFYRDLYATGISKEDARIRFFE
jgi:chorismate dehydratase